MNLRIVVPLTQEQPSQDFQKEIPQSIPKIISKYSKEFKVASELSKVPLLLLYSIAMVETRGEHFLKSGSVYVSGAEKSVGIMQISPDNFYEVYRKELLANRVPLEAKQGVDKFLPNMNYAKQPATSQQKEQIFQALKNVQFNILAASLVFRYLLDKTIDSDGTARIDKAILLYNAGEYHKATRTPNYVSGDTTSLIKVVPTITQSYIRNIAGKNGTMYYMRLNKLA
jgi:hypothetical protein